MIQELRQIYDPKFRLLLIVTVSIGLLNAGINLWRDAAVAHAGAVFAPPASNSQSFTVGSATAAPEPQRDWLTTAEVAERERVAPRTVQSWIASGDLPALQHGREYRIPVNYTRPLSAADSGK